MLFSVKPAVCLLCVLEQSRVDLDNSSMGPLNYRAQLGAIGPITLRQALSVHTCRFVHVLLYHHDFFKSST